MLLAELSFARFKATSNSRPIPRRACVCAVNIGCGGKPQLTAAKCGIERALSRTSVLDRWPADCTA